MSQIGLRVATGLVLLLAAPAFCADNHPHVVRATVFLQRHVLAWGTVDYTADEKPAGNKTTYFIEVDNGLMWAGDEARRFSEAERNQLREVLVTMTKQLLHTFYGDDNDTLPIEMDFNVETHVIELRAQIHGSLESLVIGENGRVKSSASLEVTDATDEQVALLSNYVSGVVGYIRDSTLWWLRGLGEPVAPRRRAYLTSHRASARL